MPLLIVRNCRVFDGKSGEILDNQSIVIEEDRIREIVAGDASLNGADVIDMARRFVMPGLIDAHFHSYGIEANPALVDAYAPEMRALHARRILEATLRRGYTTIRDAAGGDVHLATAIKQGLIDGPRLFYPGLALSQTGGHGDPRKPDHHAPCACSHCGAMAMLVDGPDEMRKAVREQLRTGATHIKLFVSGGVLSPSDPFWMNQFSEEEIRVAVEEAATRRVYVMAHAHTNEATIRCLRNGVRSIEHATQLAPDGAQAIVDHDAFAVPTLAIVEAITELGPRLGLTDEMLDKARAVSDDAIRSLELLKQAGARIGFGTDLLGGMMDRQSREFILRRDVFTPLEILRQATSINAELIQMAGQLGCIAPDAYADLIALDGDPMVDIGVMNDPARLAFVMRGGRIVSQTFA